MLALLLGAGFSKWAVDLPVASQLFDFAIEPFGSREAKMIAAVQTLKNTWDLNHPNEYAEKFIADAMQFPVKNKQAVLAYIVRRLSEPFIWKEFYGQRQRRHYLMIDENRRFEIPGIRKAKDFIEQFQNSQLGGIITTNYDLIAEFTLGTKSFNYGVTGQQLTGRGPYPVSTWQKPVRLTGTIPLAKIHGSVSWDYENCYTDGRRGLTGNALIVAPTPEKQPPESLKGVWNLAERILTLATRLVVFGFAFNPYDELATVQEFEPACCHQTWNATGGPRSLHMKCCKSRSPN